MRRKPSFSEVPAGLEHDVETWESGRAIIRVHHSQFGATEFNPGVGSGRFHPLRLPRSRAVPTLYGSETLDGALSETIFHDVPMRRPNGAVPQATLMPMVACTLTPRRSLTLIQLRGAGLQKLGLSRKQLIETEADSYDLTRAWAVALYRSVADADGLIWTSRQHPGSAALVLFGTRVRRRDLEVIAAPRSLYPPAAGWNDVLASAEAAGITIVIP
jgi:hypothetical protein